MVDFCRIYGTVFFESVYQKNVFSNYIEKVIDASSEKFETRLKLFKDIECKLE